MRRRPPRSTRTDTLFPNTTLFRSMTKAVSGTRKGSPTKEYTFGVAISSDSLGKALASEAPQPPFDEANIASPDLVFLTLPENPNRSEEHTSELQSLLRISYSVFRLKNKITTPYHSSSTIQLQ